MLFMRVVVGILKIPFLGGAIKKRNGFSLALLIYVIGFRGRSFFASVTEKTISSSNSMVDRIRLVFLWI